MVFRCKLLLRIDIRKNCIVCVVYTNLIFFFFFFLVFPFKLSLNFIRKLRILNVLLVLPLILFSFLYYRVCLFFFSSSFYGKLFFFALLFHLLAGCVWFTRYCVISWVKVSYFNCFPANLTLWYFFWHWDVIHFLSQNKAFRIEMHLSIHNIFI